MPLWLRALDQAAGDDSQAALHTLERMEAISPEICKAEAGVELAILKVFVLEAVGKPNRSFDVAIDAFRRIQEAKRYTLYEKEYLLCYVSIVATRVLDELHESRRHPFRVDFSRVDLNKVPNHLKRKFPIKQHPEWEHSPD